MKGDFYHPQKAAALFKRPSLDRAAYNRREFNEADYVAGALVDETTVMVKALNAKFDIPLGHAWIAMQGSLAGTKDTGYSAILLYTTPPHVDFLLTTVYEHLISQKALGIHQRRDDLGRGACYDR